MRKHAAIVTEYFPHVPVAVYIYIYIYIIELILVFNIAEILLFGR